MVLVCVKTGRGGESWCAGSSGAWEAVEGDEGGGAGGEDVFVGVWR